MSLLFTYSSISEEIFRIEIGTDYNRYSDSDLRRRVWELERAVWQLQMKVFQIEMRTLNANPTPLENWVCKVMAMGETYTGSGNSRPVAKAKAMEECRKKRGDTFFCKETECEK